MTHYSKKDAWLFLIVALSVAVPLIIAAYNFLAPGGNAQLAWALLLDGSATGAVVLLLTYPLRYEIERGSLAIRCGVLPKRVIPLASIIEAFPSRNPLSAPAWSLDRVEIFYEDSNGRRSRALISPEDKQAFMRDLVNSTNGLELRGDRVLRVA